MSRTRPTRRHLAPAALTAGVVASAALALATTGTLSAFTAQITNSANTVASGSLVMQETSGDGATTCLSTDTTGAANGVNTNAFSCTTINKYGGAILVPGASVSTTVAIKNAGNVPATTFTLAPGTCVQSVGPSANPSGNATDLCTKLSVAVTSGAATITPANSTATSLAGTSITLATPVAPGETRSYTFAVSLASAVGNTYQNLRATQPLVGTFTA